MRKRIIAGNWKMNLTFEEAGELIDQLDEYLQGTDTGNREVILFPPYVYLELTGDIAEENAALSFGAQNVSEHDAGAYTGEISARMLASMGVEYVIVGHSERRKYFHETNEILAQKVNQCLEHDMNPVFCIGEVLEQREAGKHFEVIKTQLQEGLFHLNKEEIRACVIAYEPVWAIGTGVTASPAQAEEMHAYIRQLLAERYDAGLADEIRILYGGSVKASNAAEIFAQENVDGGLIGGASLKFEEFAKIIEA